MSGLQAVIKAVVQKVMQVVVPRKFIKPKTFKHKRMSFGSAQRFEQFVQVRLTKQRFFALHRT